MKTIGFDIDGVIYDFHTSAYNHLRFYHGLEQDFKSFWVDEQGGMGKYNTNFWSNFLKIPIIYESHIISGKDLETLNNLAKNYEIIYVTHRPVEVKFATLEWFKRNKLPYADNIYFVRDKTIPILRHQCKYFIDDMVKNIEDIEKVTNAILMKKTWHTKEDLNYTYIESLNELEALL